ncbi:GCN5 family acetyltransferase [Altererythrobacter sp. B11]|uniref:GNAT family N-acetyltransferase n=1 Tax=Altererythrobacter sp. B11 TaxID=2060312 RepID=UPI000DC6DFC9|nr:N-acetyltransferase [Altererythrobacter sp. B11]BBC71190.1 GCN5 family acetyltransferase [Altererythrobacter sp. B11]
MSICTVRQEQPGDETAIAALTQAAFRGAPYSRGDEAAVVSRLRAAGDLTLSLVALNMDLAVIGHAAFSPVSISDGTSGWLGIGPVSVMPLRQRAGIGSRLVETGLERLSEMGAKGCVVLGEPEYYHRFGFVTDPHLTLPGAPAAYFQRLVLSGWAPRGTVSYAPAFA